MAWGSLGVEEPLFQTKGPQFYQMVHILFEKPQNFQKVPLLCLKTTSYILLKSSTILCKRTTQLKFLAINLVVVQVCTQGVWLTYPGIGNEMVGIENYKLWRSEHVSKDH